MTAVPTQIDRWDRHNGTAGDRLFGRIRPVVFSIVLLIAL
jgi:hypothetical protein